MVDTAGFDYDYEDDEWAQEYQDSGSGLVTDVYEGRIWLDGFPLRVTNGIYTNMSTFDRPVQQGDPSRNSDAIISTRVYSDISGGGQMKRDRPDSTNRYSFATLNTRHINLVTLNRRVLTFAPAGASTDNCYPLGMLGGKAWVAFGNRIFGWNPATRTLDGALTVTLPSPPVGRSVRFYDELWIPRGSGYSRFNGTSLINDATIAAIDLTIWDQKVIALTQSGHLRIYLKVGTPGWEPEKPELQPPYGVPRRLGVFKLNDEKTLHLLTDERAYAYDAAGPRLIETDLEFPAQPYAANAIATFNQDFYVNQSTQIITYTGGSRDNNRGLDRDDGLPAEYNGTIVDLLSESNGLYALVEGRAVAVADQSMIQDEPLPFDDPSLFPPRSTSSAMLFWTGFGWHTLWTTGEGGEPTWSMVVSNGQYPDAYGIMWGYGGKLHYSQLIYLNSNPVIGMQQGVDEFAVSGYLDFPWYDFNMYGYPKTASHFLCRAPVMPTGSRVRILYRVDEQEAFTILGDIDAPGNYAFAFGEPLPHLQIGEGIGFERIQLRYEVERQETGTVTLRGEEFNDIVVPTEKATPVIDSAVLHVLKEPLEGSGFEFTVLLDGDEEQNLTWQQTADLLDQLVRPGRFLEMQVGDRFARVRLAYINGDQPSGMERIRQRRLSAVTINTGLEPEQGAIRVRRTASIITNQRQVLE